MYDKLGSVEELAFIQGMVYGKFDWLLDIANDEPDLWEMFVVVEHNLEVWFVLTRQGLEVKLRGTPSDIGDANSHGDFFALLAKANRVHEAIQAYLSEEVE